MFTLEIVLLVVVVIVGLGAGVVVTSRRSRSSTVEADVERVESKEATVLEGVEELAEGFAEGLESDLAEQVEEVLKDVVVPAPPTFKERLGKARGLFTGVLTTLRSGAVLSDGVWDELEEALIRADVGVATTDALLADLRKRVATKELTEPRQVVVALRSEMVRLLSVDDLGDDLGDGEGVSDVGRRSLRFDGIPGTTDVWLFVGVNGVGKTTTVGKVARQQAAIGRSVLLAAGDTFRAAAGEQLAMWAERSGAEIVRGAEGGDPSAIVFDSVQRASARGNDLVLADTAGRLHTKVNLVEELKKIRRVADRPPGRVTEVLLVLDATTGQNALNQAREFTEAVEVTGVVLTKLDGTAKGGVVIAIQRELGIPVKMVGLGERPDDLVAFDPEAFVDALFD